MKTTPAPTLLTDAELLDPPRGYRPLAWLGLLANLLIVPLVLAVILTDPTWRITNIVVGASAVLPTAALGVVASIALLRWRHWGQILAIVALSLSLAICLPYSIVRPWPGCSMRRCWCSGAGQRSADTCADPFLHAPSNQEAQGRQGGANQASKPEADGKHPSLWFRWTTDALPEQ